MGEADRLEVVDVDHLADRALVEQAAHHPCVRRVPQHVTDGGDHAAALDAATTRRTPPRWCDWLLDSNA